jgi:hypothetical protein
MIKKTWAWITTVIPKVVSVIFRWAVFGPILGAIACVAGILRLLGSTDVSPYVSNQTLIYLCVVVFFCALAVASREGRQIYKRSTARTELTLLVGEGKVFVGDLSQDLTEITGPQATNWIARVETCLKKYLHASFVTRFKTNYASGGQAYREYPYLPEMQMKVEKLEEFLVELDD